MRKCIRALGFTLLLLIVSLNQSSADQSVIESTVQPFLAALKAGDIPAITSYVSGSLSQNIADASRQNEDYGAFLRERYANATFSPAIIQQEEQKAVVSVNVDFAGEGASVFELLLEKESAGSWRIIDQYSPSTKF